MAFDRVPLEGERLELTAVLVQVSLDTILTKDFYKREDKLVSDTRSWNNSGHE